MEREGGLEGVAECAEREEEEAFLVAGGVVGSKSQGDGEGVKDGCLKGGQEDGSGRRTCA